jgi:hypothetical protein
MTRIPHPSCGTLFFFLEVFSMLTLAALLARFRTRKPRRRPVSAADEALVARIKFRPNLLILEDRLLPGNMLSLGIPTRPGGPPQAAAVTRSNYSSHAATVVTSQTTRTTAPVTGQTATQTTTAGTATPQLTLPGKGVPGDGLPGLTDDLGANLDNPSTPSHAPTSLPTTPVRADLGTGGGGGGGSAAGAGGFQSASASSGGGATANGNPGAGFFGPGGAPAAAAGQSGGGQGSALPGSHSGAPAAGKNIAPSGYVGVTNAVTRTQEQMTQAELNFTQAPPRPAGFAVNRPAPAASGAAPVSQTTSGTRSAGGVFGPLGGDSRPSGPGIPPPAASPPHALTPNFAGGNESEQTNYSFIYPPDTDGAIGANNFVEVVNNRISIYSRTGVRQNGPLVGGVHQGVYTGNFFGNTAADYTDPRVLYDPIWQRFIVTEIQFAQNSSTCLLFVAVSKTSNPNGAWWIFNTNTDSFFGANNNGFWDYPMLGMTQDAVLFSGNEFFGGGGAGGEVFAVAKAHIYNGIGWFVPVFMTAFNTQLPVVIDQSDTAFLASPSTDSGHLLIYTFEDAANAFEATLSGPTSVATDNSAPPRAANQPGTGDQLDVLDGRFQNNTTQNGSSLWLIHTANDGGFPTPEWYEINTSSMTVNQSGFFFSAGSSDDFNPSIVANSSNDVFVCWTSTNSSAGTNAQVRFGGRLHTDPLGSMSVQATPLFTSSSNLTGNGGATQRWGDYSAVTVDPKSPLQAWIVNEDIIDTNHWGSRVGHISF